MALFYIWIKNTLNWWNFQYHANVETSFWKIKYFLDKGESSLIIWKISPLSFFKILKFHFGVLSTELQSILFDI